MIPDPFSKEVLLLCQSLTFILFFIILSTLSTADGGSNQIESLYNEVFLKEWGLHPPDLVLSVLGSNRKVNVKHEVEEVFQRVLQQLMQKTSNMWIFTGGGLGGELIKLSKTLSIWIMKYGVEIFFLS
jgi:hypothetical protein